MDDEKNAIFFFLPWRSDESTGGVNNVLSSLYGCFQADGKYKPIIIEDTWESKLPKYRRNHGDQDVIECRIRPLPKTIIECIISLLLLPSQFYTYQKLFQKHKVRVLNFHYPSTNVLWFCIMKKLGLFAGKIILSFHGDDVNNVVNNGIINQLVWKLITSLSDKYVTCSEDLSVNLLKKIPAAKSSDFRVVHNGINPDKFLFDKDTDLSGQSRLQNKRYILSVGKFVSDKGHATLIEAFANVHIWHPDLSLILIGGVGEDLDLFKKLVQDLDIESKVEIIVDVPNNQVCSYFKHAEIFVLASHREAFPLVILEAGISRIPVVSTGVTGISEILKDQRNSYLFPVGDTNKLSVILNNVLNETNKKEAFVENLYQDIIQHFLWENAYQKYINLLDEN